MKKTIPPFSLRLDPDLRARVEAAAAKEDRSISNYIQKVLSENVPTQKKKR